MSFYLFVKENAGRNDPVGDYCADTLRIIKLYPDKIKRLSYKKDFAALFNLVSAYHICQEARDAFEDAWKEYRQL